MQVRWIAGILCASITIAVFWRLFLTPNNWPAPSLVLSYFYESLQHQDVYKSLLMTGIRALLGMGLGFGLALVFSLATGRSQIGWLFLFFALLALQKIPAVAMVYVLVHSSLGIGFLMTLTLSSVVVMSFSWLVLHHRACTLNPREIFALRVLGIRGWKLALYGTLPHLGSTIGGTARLAISISLVMVVLGEWQGVWADGTILQYGLGIEISRAYDSIDSQARVLAYCLWLGILGILLDAVVLVGLRTVRQVSGVCLEK